MILSKFFRVYGRALLEEGVPLFWSSTFTYPIREDRTTVYRVLEVGTNNILTEDHQRHHFTYLEDGFAGVKDISIARKLTGLRVTVYTHDPF